MLTKKITKYVFLTVLMLSGMLTYAPLTAQNHNLTIHMPARSLANAEKLEREIGFLSDAICAGRATGTGGNVEAAEWISRKFRDLELMQFNSSWAHSVPTPNGTPARNIMGFLPGSSKGHPDKYIIIGAHYDHIGTINGRLYPGADANASGVAAMTTLAEMVSVTRGIGISYLHNLIFVAFDGKEMDMAGSKGLWEMIRRGELTDPATGCRITPDRISMMVNIDQVGSAMSPLNKNREDYLIMLDGRIGKTAYKFALRSCNERYGLDMDLGYTYYGSENFTRLFYSLSDQKVFSDNGIPAVMFTSGITMNNNKPRDTVSSLDMEILVKRIHLMYHWLTMMM